MVLYCHLGCSFQNIFSSCFSYSEASVLEIFRIRAKGYCVAEAIVESLEQSRLCSAIFGKFSEKLNKVACTYFTDS